MNYYTITLYNYKSTRKNSKCFRKTINIYHNNAKLDGYDIKEYLHILEKNAIGQRYGIVIYNNITMLTSLHNLSLYQLKNVFTKMIDLINKDNIIMIE